MSDATIIQAAPAPGVDLVYPHLLEEFKDEPQIRELVEKRIEFGFQKYKQYLMTFDGRNTDVELIQEQLDEMFYAKKGYLETGDITYNYIYRTALANLRLVLANRNEPTEPAGF